MPRRCRNFVPWGDHTLDRRLIPSALVAPAFHLQEDPIPDPEPSPGLDPGTHTPTTPPPLPPSGPIGPGTS